MARFSLHAVGRDRPGIIARVAEALAALGANLGDSRMTILHGQFAIMLVLEAPGIADGGLVEGALAPVADELNLFIAVRPLPEGPTLLTGGQRLGVAVEGADRPGIVAGVTGALAGLGANVVELASRRIERDGESGYVLRVSVVLPHDREVAELEAVLATVSAELGVRSRVALDADDLD